MIYLFSILSLISAIFCIRAKYKKSKNQLLIFKPLTLILILLIATVSPAIEPSYKIFIVSGLLFSLLGDIFLIYPEQHFKNGLIAFLIGHVCYIVAFSVSTNSHFSFWLFIFEVENNYYITFDNFTMNMFFDTRFYLMCESSEPIYTTR